jgi:hypothetical protein
LGVALTVTADPLYTRAWILEPTYFLAAGIFGDTGMRMEGVDVGGADEWDLSQLRKRIEECGRDTALSVSRTVQISYIMHPFAFGCAVFRNLSLVTIQQCIFISPASNSPCSSFVLFGDGTWLRRFSIVVSTTSPPCGFNWTKGV